MDWVTLLITVLGAVGGLGGIISIYQAKSNKDTIDINNFHQLIEEERTERQILRQEYEDYKVSVNRRVNEVKLEVAQMKANNDRLTMAIFSAYKCPKVDDVNDCPVIQTYKSCTNCNLHNEREDEI